MQEFTIELVVVPAIGVDKVFELVLASYGANPSGIRRRRKPYPFDANCNKIRPGKVNKGTGNKQTLTKENEFFII